MNSRPRHASRAIVKTSRVSDRSLCKKKHPDFSDALRKRGIEEVNTPWRADDEHSISSIPPHDRSQVWR